jgi:hypothetical protein
VKAKLLTQHVARHLAGQGIDVSILHGVRHLLIRMPSSDWFILFFSCGTQLEKSNSLLADSKLRKLHSPFIMDVFVSWQQL